MNISLNGNEEDLYIQSTDIYRTLQSGYSEMMGMLEGRDRLKISSKQRSALLTGRGAPPFSVTNTTEIDAQLQDYAIVEGYAGFPLHTFLEDDLDEPQWDDDLGYTVCPKVNEVTAIRGNNDTYYADLIPLKKLMADKFVEEYGHSVAFFTNLTVHDLAGYADMVFSEAFEGVKQKVEWIQQWNNIMALLDSLLLNPYSEYARQLMVTKQLIKPVSEIQEIILGSGTYTGPKYRLYSAHDTNIANILKQINPTFSWHGIRYASNIYFEVHQDIIRKTYHIKVMYNGQPLILEECKKVICEADEFLFQMQSQLTYFNELRDDCYSSDSERSLRSMLASGIKHPKFLQFIQ